MAISMSKLEFFFALVLAFTTLLMVTAGDADITSDFLNSAIAISAFGSANAGTISVPTSVFTTGIDNGILAKSFNTNIATIQAIKAWLTPQSIR
ncbi:hypothetical protein CMV_029691 [Castanea mollissima]|uniref:Uncharacterized protein n=1 Tax=Castanea mollissima TaxID=60419 RepID=A0A8J4VD64_9ROSI|nr:hypothetical protein CMV_029691 [Castanea mollissima]